MSTSFATSRLGRHPLFTWGRALSILVILVGFDAHAAPPTSAPGDAHFGSGRPWIDVRYYGAVGDGVTDDTTAIQNAFNAVRTVYNQQDSTGAQIQLNPTVFFPTGKYRVTGTLLWNSGTLQGCNHNSVLIWGGAQGGVMIKNDTAHSFYPQGLTQRGVYDLAFQPAVGATPGCYLDVRGYLVDWGGRLERLSFGATADPSDGGPAAAIRTDSIVNGQWSDLRFEDYFGYAIHIAHGVGAGNRQFNIDGFEVRITAGNPNGFVKVQELDTSSFLNIDLSHGRIESAVAWTNAPAAILSVGGVTGIVPASITLRNIDAQIGPPGSLVTLVDQSPTTLPTASVAQVAIKNVRASLSAVLGGSWGPAITVPPPISGPIAFWATGRLNSGAANLTLLQMGPLAVRTDGTVQLPNLTALPAENPAAGQLAVVNGKVQVFAETMWVPVGLQNAGANSASVSAISIDTAGPNIGAARLQMSGVSGLNVMVQASTDLINWGTVGTGTFGSGTLSFLDTSSINYPWRFYRAVTP